MMKKARTTVKRLVVIRRMAKGPFIMATRQIRVTYNNCNKTSSNNNVTETTRKAIIAN